MISHQPRPNPIVKPLVVLAAKFLGPGRLRLEMVKLAHGISDVRGEGQTIEPDRRAA